MTTTILLILFIINRSLTSNLSQGPPADVPTNLPWRKHVATLEDLFHLLQCSAHCLGEHEKHMDKGGEIKCPEDKVRFPCDTA